MKVGLERGINNELEVTMTVISRNVDGASRLRKILAVHGRFPAPHDRRLGNEPVDTARNAGQTDVLIVILLPIHFLRPQGFPTSSNLNNVE